jgi:DNA-binding SARP family transcriptional activator/energy-coupling factor transporter ATP-binding protein EcfA2
MEVRVLGSLRVRNGSGTAVTLGAKERLILALLVARLGQVVTVDELIDTLWPQDPPRTARRTLQAYMARIRGELGRGADDGRSSGVITSDAPGYRLALDPLTVDAEQFVRLAGLGSAALVEGRAGAALEALNEALALWRGPAYAGFEDAAFARGEARRLEELRRTAQEDRFRARLAAGTSPAAVAADLEAHVAAEPLRESGWALLATAYAAVGDQAAALGAIVRARTILAEELGVDLGPELRALQGRLLAQDPMLLAGPGGSAGRAGTLPAALEPFGRRLVGRTVELDLLLEHWARAVAGGGSRVLLVGPEGSGRWRLACALAGRVQAEAGGIVLGSGPVAAPALRVVDARGDGPTQLPPPGERELQVVVTDPRAGLPADAVVSLGPLTEPDVVSLLRDLAPVDVHHAVLSRAAAEVMVRAGPSVDAVQDASVRWLRDLLAGRVAGATRRTADADARLTAERLALAREVEHWRGVASPDPAETAGCPWPGLGSYHQQDGRWFAGRERLTAELVARIGTGSPLLLVGASGVGKSSLLEAGLLAALADDALPGSSGWVRLSLRPGAHPLQALVASLATAATDEPTVPTTLHAALDSLEPTPLLLVIDQLEECWTACTEPAEREAFLDALVGLAARDEGPVQLVAAVRADQAGHVSDHPGLADLLAGTAVFVGAMTEPELRRAITMPAERAGLVLDAGLVDTLVDDTLREPGGLPLLSTALAALWERRTGPHLLLAEYLSSGGVASAVAQLAEQALATLDPAERHAAPVLFRRLAGPGADDRVTRRQVGLDELAALPDPAVLGCVPPLAAARLLTISDGRVEVAHESVFRSWPRLREWLADDAVARDLLRRVGVGAAEWIDDGREPALLWSGARQLAAADLLARHPEGFTAAEAAFVRAGTQRAEAQAVDALAQAQDARRQNRRLQALLVGLVGALAIALCASALAVHARDDARARGRTADAQRLAATALTDPDLASRMLTAVEAVRTEESPQTVGALLSVLAASGAVLARVSADSPIVDLALGPGGATAYAATQRGRVVALDLVTGIGTPVWHKPGASLSAIRVSPDGRHLAVSYVSGGGRYLVTLDADGRNPWAVPFSAFLEQGITFVANDELALATSSGLVRMRLGQARPLGVTAWPRIEGLQQARLLRAGDGHVLLLQGSAGAPGRLVDLRTGAVTLLDRAGPVGAVSPDGRFLATQPAFPGPVVVTALDRPGEPDARMAFPDQVASIQLLEDRVVLGGAAGLVQIIGTATSLPAASFRAGGARVTGLVVQEATGTLWTAGADGDLVAWDLTGERTLGPARRVSEAGGTGAVDAAGQVAAIWVPGATGSISTGQARPEPDEVRVLDLVTDHPLVTMVEGVEPLGGDSAGRVCAAAMTPDGARALVASVSERPDQPAYDGRIAAYDLAAAGAAVGTPLPWGACGIAVSPDGRAAFANGEGGMAMLEASTGRLLGEHPLPTMSLQQSPVVVSPDGLLVAAARGTAVVVLAAADLREVASWPLDDGDSVRDLEWLDDGRHVGPRRQGRSAALPVHPGRRPACRAPGRRVGGGDQPRRDG